HSLSVEHGRSPPAWHHDSDPSLPGPGLPRFRRLAVSISDDATNRSTVVQRERLASFFGGQSTTGHSRSRFEDSAAQPTADRSSSEIRHADSRSAGSKRHAVGIRLPPTPE